MAKQTINIGQSVNDRHGDPLRTAFDKINQNFTELYTAIGVSESTEFGNVRFVNDKMYDLNGLDISNDDLIHGATARLQLPANGSSSSINLLNYYGNVAVTSGLNPGSTVGWIFGNDGTINVPHLLPKTFTAVLDTAHMYPQPGTGLTDAPWELQIQFQVNPNGSVETISNNIFPNLVNPGYVSGKTFAFTEVDHGIPGYTLQITLNDVVLPGSAGWTANIAFSQPPNYVPAVKSTGAIKLTANTSDWVLGTDGKLTLPAGGDIVNSNGASVLGIASDHIVNATTLTRVDAAANSINITCDSGEGAVGYYFSSTGELHFNALNANPAVASDSHLSLNAADYVQLVKSSNSLNSSIIAGNELIELDVQNFNQGGYDWRWYFNNVGQFQLPAAGAIVQNNSYTKVKNSVVSGSSVVWVSSNRYISSVKLTIQAEASETNDNTGWHTQTCEAIITARGARGDSEPQMTVYGVIHTSIDVLVTFTVQRNITTNLIEVVGTSTSAAGSAPNLKIYSVELLTNN